MSRLEYAVRLLVQAHACPAELADRLATSPTNGVPIWDGGHARRVRLRVASYRAAEQRQRGDEVLALWANACESALPDPNDERRHVRDDILMAEGSSQAVLRERMFFLEQLQDSLIRLRRLDEALEAVELTESVRARIPVEG